MRVDTETGVVWVPSLSLPQFTNRYSCKDTCESTNETSSQDYGPYQIKGDVVKDNLHFGDKVLDSFPFI